MRVVILGHVGYRQGNQQSRRRIDVAHECAETTLEGALQERDSMLAVLECEETTPVGATAFLPEATWTAYLAEARVTIESERKPLSKMREPGGRHSKYQN